MESYTKSNTLLRDRRLESCTHARVQSYTEQNLEGMGFNTRRDATVAAYDLVPEPHSEEDRHQRDRDVGTHIEKCRPGTHSYIP